MINFLPPTAVNQGYKEKNKYCQFESPFFLQTHRALDFTTMFQEIPVCLQKHVIKTVLLTDSSETFWLTFSVTQPPVTDDSVYSNSKV